MIFPALRQWMLVACLSLPVFAPPLHGQAPPATTAPARATPAPAAPLSAQRAQPSQEFIDLFRKAQQAFQARDFTNAVALIDKAELLEPGLAPALNLKGAALVQLRRLEDAEAVFKRLVETEPLNASGAFNLGEVYFVRRDFKAAREQFAKFLAFPGNAQNELGNYKLFLACLMLDDKKESERLLISFGSDQNRPVYWFSHAARAMHTRDAEKARAFLKTAGSKYPAQTVLLFLDSMVELGWVRPEQRPAAAPAASQPGGDLQEFNPGSLDFNALVPMLLQESAPSANGADTPAQPNPAP